MAKKLNKKVLYTLLAIGLVCFLGVLTVGFKYIRERNPEYCLNKARQLFKEGNFEEAGGMFGKAYGRSKEDSEKIAILFEMAEFHLTPGEKHEPDWVKAMQCWNTVINIDPQHVEARRKLLDFYYQSADSGNEGAWKLVEQNASKLLEIQQATSQPLDPNLLLAEARATIAIARLGNVADRSEMLNRSFASLEKLQKIDPENIKAYSYQADAIILKGEMDEMNGIPGSKDASQKQAVEILTQALDKVSDKAEAHADLFEMRIRQADDPNTLAAVRKEGEKLVEMYPQSSRLMSLLSACYEMRGKMDRQKEMDLAIEYLKKVISMPDGKTVANALRLASMLYRTGNFYKNESRVQEALQVVDAAFSYPEAIVLPGPKEGAARQARVVIRLFEAKMYHNLALQAREKADEQAVKNYSAKFNDIVEGIVQAVGEKHNLTRIWRGMQLVVDDKPEQAYVALYNVYQELITQDKAGEPSTVDSYLCYILSRLAARQGAVGMQREFLEKAIYNRTGIGSDKPDAILDYAGLAISLQAAERASQIIDSYINLYGMDKKAGLLLAQAYSQMNKYDQAEKLLDKLDASDPEVLSSRLLLVTTSLMKAQQGNSAGEGSKIDVKAIRKKQYALVDQMLEIAPEKIDLTVLAGISRNAVANDDIQTAQGWINRYLEKNPDNVIAMLLKQEFAEPDPKAVSGARRLELYEQVIAGIQDPVKKMIEQVRYYRSVGKTDQAKQIYPQLLSAAPDNLEVANDYFNFLLEQKDVNAAEEFFGKIRNLNPDGCEGRLFAAQLEMAKENYAVALQRLDECLALRPALSAVMVLKSQIYQRQEKYDAAVEAASHGSRIDPRNPLAARQLASVLFDRNRQLGSQITSEQAAEAERAVGMAMLLNPTDWQLQSVYAETVSEHNPEQGLAIRQSLLKNIPNATNAALLGNMAMRLAGKETSTAKREALIQIASDAYERGWQIDSKDPLLQSSYAEFLRKTNQSQKAAEIFGSEQRTLWRFYLSNGQYDKAKEILEKLQQQNPADVEVLQGLADASQGMNHWEQMKAYLDSLTQKQLSTEQEIWLIQKYLEGGMSEPAEKQLNAFQGRYPSDNRIQLLSAWLDMTKGNFELALEKADKYIEKEPQNASAWRLKGRIYRLLNQPQQAIEALLRSKNIASDTAVIIELATLYSQTKQVEAAAGELNAALQNPQAPAQIRTLLESLYQDNKRWTELSQFYKQTLEKFPNDPYWTTRFGEFYLEQKDYGNALAMFEKVLAVTSQGGPGDPVALDNYLKTLIEANRLDAVIPIATKFIDGPLAPVAYWNIAAVQAKQNQSQQAMETFAKAIDLTSNSPWLLMTALTAMGKSLGEASVVSWCENQLTKNPSFVPAHLMLAGIAERSGAFNKALSHIHACMMNVPQNSAQGLELSNRKANILIQAYAKTGDMNYLTQAVSQLEASLKLQPNDPTMMNNIAYLLAENDMKLDEAVEYARQAYQRAPGNSVVLDTYAFALCKAGDFAQAEKYINQVLLSYERNGTTPPWDVYKHQGMILKGLKKNKEALVAFEKAIELGKDIPEKEKQFLNESIESLK